MSNALATQVGGDHYKKLGLQPLEFTYILGGSPAMCKFVKYVSRDKDSLVQDIQKGLHVQAIEEALDPAGDIYPLVKMKDAQYLILASKVSPDVNVQRAILGCIKRDGQMISKACDLIVLHHNAKARDAALEDERKAKAEALAEVMDCVKNQDVEYNTQYEG